MSVPNIPEKVEVVLNQCGASRLVLTWTAYNQPSLYINREVAQQIVSVLEAWLEETKI